MNYEKFHPMAHNSEGEPPSVFEVLLTPPEEGRNGKFRVKSGRKPKIYMLGFNAVDRKLRYLKTSRHSDPTFMLSSMSLTKRYEESYRSIKEEGSGRIAVRGGETLKIMPVGLRKNWESLHYTLPDGSKTIFRNDCLHMMGREESLYVITTSKDGSKLIGVKGDFLYHNSDIFYSAMFEDYAPPEEAIQRALIVNH